MFTTVAKNFSKFLAAYFCLLVAFALSFIVLFPNYQVSQKIFCPIYRKKAWYVYGQKPLGCYGDFLATWVLQRPGGQGHLVGNLAAKATKWQKN